MFPKDQSTLETGHGGRDFRYCPACQGRAMQGEACSRCYGSGLNKDTPVPAPVTWPDLRASASPTDPMKPALERQEGGGHYKGMAIQPFEYIHANGLGFAEGCVVKYVSRWRAKGGVEDLRKARHFLDLLIEAEGGTVEKA